MILFISHKLKKRNLKKKPQEGGFNQISKENQNKGAVAQMDAMQVLARGNIAVIFETPDTNTVVKFQKNTLQQADEMSTLCSLSPYEVDICRLLWTSLAPTGLSRHICRAIGKTVLFNGRGGDECRVGLEMERLHGDGTGSLNLEDLILFAASGRRGEDATFGETLRGMIFQVLFTLSMCTFAFNGLFRHNDLHLRNVCFTPWNSAGAPLLARYAVRCFPERADGMFVDRYFTFASVYRAVIIDFGWAALLPGMGPELDARFFRAAATSSSAAAGKPAVIDILASDSSFKDSGMSQQVPCQTYDAALLMYSIYTVSLTAIAMSTCPSVVAQELRAFNAFYETAYKSVPHVAGRLGLPLQRHLLRARTVPGSAVAVPTLETLLRSNYFSAFRCETEASAAVVHSFGCDASSAVKIENEGLAAFDGESQECPLAGKGAWNIDAHGIGHAPTGAFSDLLAEVMKNIARWKTGVAFRKMYPDEEAAWKTEDASVCTAVLSSHAFAAPLDFLSPRENLFAPTERICVRSPK